VWPWRRPGCVKTHYGERLRPFDTTERKMLIADA
jgi:hypothetical protein